MQRFIPATFNLDPETRILLELVAEKDKDAGEGANQSRTLRKLIREKAAQLGIEIPTKATKQKTNA